MKTIEEYYNNYSENDRISYENSIERIRTQNILDRYIDSKSKSILDIGGGTGVHSFYLADKGYDVSLIDFVPRHIEIVKNKNTIRGNKLKEINVGDACHLLYEDNSFDVALLFGPLYHLCKRADRITAIKETMRILNNNGIAFISIISKFASLIDGYKYNFINDARFREILDNDIKNGNHFNNTENLYYFMDTYFHSVDDIIDEVNDAGYCLKKIIAVEGFSNSLLGVEDKLVDESYKKYLLQKILETEEDKSLLGISSHVIGIIQKSQ
jgi:ubiquinone/menaquinone biosynthesis C-methylase UbiE